MSWRKISMKFAGTCVVCNERIEVNEIGLWSKGLGVKHERCSQVKELRCTVCGGPAGCDLCEFRDDCDLDMVSQACMCKKCSDAENSFSSYKSAVKKRFHVLNI